MGVDVSVSVWSLPGGVRRVIQIQSPMMRQMRPFVLREMVDAFSSFMGKGRRKGILCLKESMDSPNHNQPLGMIERDSCLLVYFFKKI